MVKNKALPDSARLCTPRSGHSLSFSLPRRLGPIKAGLNVSSLTDAVHREGTPWILPRLDPGNLMFFRLNFEALRNSQAL